MTNDSGNAHDILLTAKDLAARWGVSVESLAQDRHKGRSPVRFIKLGERVRYRLADILAVEIANTVDQHRSPTVV